MAAGSWELKLPPPPTKKLSPYEGKEKMTLTLGDQAESDHTLPQYGHALEKGLSKQDLEAIGKKAKEDDPTCEVELVDLKALAEAPADVPQAYLLRIKKHKKVDAEALYAEQVSARLKEKRDKYLLNRGKTEKTQKLQNKTARHCLVFADQEQESDWTKGLGSVIGFATVPVMNAVRTWLVSLLAAAGVEHELVAEGNYYFHKEAGIGLHGDAERWIVLAIRLGQVFPLVYQAFRRTTPVGKKVVLEPEVGELYIMSEAAVGRTWRSGKGHWRHAAGHEEYHLSNAEKKVRGEERKRERAKKKELRDGMKKRRKMMAF